jgi:N-6 DNA Methylase
MKQRQLAGDYTKEHTKEAKDERGEVFTPECLVEEMLSRLEADCFTSGKRTFLDNSAGNGNMLVKILEQRLKHKVPHLDAIKTLYGIELEQTNAVECRERLSLGSKDPEIWATLLHNIICADALDPKHPGWHDVGYMWNEKKAKHTKEVEAFFEH